MAVYKLVDGIRSMAELVITEKETGSPDQIFMVRESFEELYYFSTGHVCCHSI